MALQHRVGARDAHLHHCPWCYESAPCVDDRCTVWEVDEDGRGYGCHACCGSPECVASEETAEAMRRLGAS